jgi:hypothetical protein
VGQAGRKNPDYQCPLAAVASPTGFEPVLPP